MRRINSDFRTAFLSEEGQKLSNRDYFGYVEMDDYACYVLADSLDGETQSNSAKLVVESLIRSFSEGPSLRKGKLKSYLRAAHRQLRQMRGGMHLKASVILVATDYRNMRYCYVGNSRMYLLRNSRFLIRTKDQSLARNLLEQEKIPLDQAAAHEERNNLYSYLGGKEPPKPVISNKIRLEDGDILEVTTRGVWENCRDEELLEASKDAKEPQEILNQVEDLILARQEEHSIDNYSLAVTFVDKVYRSPRKKVSVRQVLMVLLPVVIAAGGLGLFFYLRHQNQVKSREQLEQAMASGETYLRYDNYQKAAQEYGTALELANELGEDSQAQEADQYLKLSEQILLADEAMGGQEYGKAQELYLTARDLSREAGNVGRGYIDGRLEETRNYMEVYDLIQIGEEKEENGNLEGALESYKQARKLASSLYFTSGKDEAMSRQAQAEEQLDQQAAEKQQEEEKVQAAAREEAAKELESQAAQQELENQQKANDQKNAIELENQGNQLLAQGQFESAITYYRTAQAIYIRLELPELADGLNAKIGAAQAGQAAKESQAAQAAEESQAAQAAGESQAGTNGGGQQSP